MGNIERTNHRAWVNIQPQTPQYLGRLGVHAPSVNNPKAMRLSAKKNILSNGSETHELDLLVDSYDAYRLRFRRVVECNGTLAIIHNTRVPSIRSRHDLNKRRFPSAVLSDQRMDLARL